MFPPLRPMVPLLLGSAQSFRSMSKVPHFPLSRGMWEGFGSCPLPFQKDFSLRNNRDARILTHVVFSTQPPQMKGVVTQIHTHPVPAWPHTIYMRSKAVSGLAS